MEGGREEECFVELARVLMSDRGMGEGVFYCNPMIRSNQGEEFAESKLHRMLG